MKEYDPDHERTVLIVSHGMVMWQFLDQIKGPDRVPANCGIAHITYDNNGVHFVELIDPLSKKNDVHLL